MSATVELRERGDSAGISMVRYAAKGRATRPRKADLCVEPQPRFAFESGARKPASQLASRWVPHLAAEG